MTLPADVLAETRPALVRFVRGLCAPGTVDDVVQETCLALLLALPSYADRGHRFTTFAFAVALNKARDAHREAARSPRPVAAVPDVPDPYPGPEETAERRVDAAYLAGLLGRLPAASREVVRLRVGAGLSAAETAGVLGMSEGAVRVAQHRALRRLRELAAACPPPRAGERPVVR